MSFGEFFDAWLMLGFLNMVKNSLIRKGTQTAIMLLLLLLVVVKAALKTV